MKKVFSIVGFINFPIKCGDGPFPIPFVRLTTPQTSIHNDLRPNTEKTVRLFCIMILSFVCENCVKIV